MRLAALMAAHNRRDKTLACLRALYANQLPAGVRLDVILVDDGSTDGTAAAVRQEFSNVEIIEGNGQLYWNRGMHRAFGRAMEIGFDAYLWLNDDTYLYPDAVLRLLATCTELRARRGRGIIVVGSAQQAVDGQTTYGGVRRLSEWRRLKFELVEPREGPVQCETMNGNCVLIPHEVAAAVGNLDARFAHAMGDTDYGLRAGRMGIEPWLAAGHVGTCEKNPGKNTFNDPSLSVGMRWRRMMQPTGLPPASWLVFTRKHAGRLWPLFFVWPYLRVMLGVGRSVRR